MTISLLNIFPFILIVGISCVPTQQNICGGVYLNDHGEIVTPNYPSSYPQHLVCRWNISVAENHSILLVFEDFYTDKRDHLNVYDVISGQLSLRGRYSGLNYPKHILSTHNNLFMNLSTTSPRKGFKLSYETINNCGGVHDQLTQIISSPGYPRRYLENSNCHWTIICPENRTINIKFLDIHFEDQHAFLTISNAYSDVLANLTGDKPQNMLLTRSNKLFLNFKADNSTNAQGFRGFSIVYTTLVVGSDLPFIISTNNAIITTNHNQTIDNIIYNSVNEYSVVEYDIHKRKLLLFDPKLSELFINHLEESQIIINARSDGIAYDWIHGLIYWIDIKMKSINVMALKTDIHLICELNDPNHRDLVINVERSEIVWSQIGHQPKIWTINSDGKYQKVLYSNSRQAFHLTISYESKRYYFVDISDFSLFSIDFSGKNENYFISSRSFFVSIISMTFINSHLYLANNKIIYRISELDSRIKRAEILYTSGRHDFTENQNFYEFKSLDTKRSQIFGFKIIDKKLQPNIINRCLNSNCDGLCLPTAQSYRCLVNLVTSSPVIMSSSSSGNTLTIFNSVIIVILVVILILLYFSVKQMIIKFENRIFQVLIPTVSFRKSVESNHEYENHDYEEPVFKK